MIPVSRFFNLGKETIVTKDGTNPDKAKVVIIQSRKKESYPPEPDDHKSEEIKSISPKKEESKKTTILKDPGTGNNVKIEEPVVIRRKR
jgi:hypothetical protein